MAAPVRSLAGLVVLFGGGLGRPFAEDSMSLLQVSTGDVEMDSAAEATQDLDESGSEDPHHKKFMIKLRDETFDCSKFPDYCRGPFNCHLPKVNTTDKGRGIATMDGHPNYQRWCKMFPRYSKPMTACVARDYQKYARLMESEHEEMGKARLKPHMLHVQSQLCFLAGHCNDTEVSESTTVADMERMCDNRWGHKSWTEYRAVAGPLAAAADSYQRGSLKLGPVLLGESFEGFKDVSVDGGVARSWAQLACGMGNYHCDVMYCKEKFCSDPDWKAKHAELSWAVAPTQAPKAPHHFVGGGRSHRNQEEWDVLLNKMVRGFSKSLR
mmetsp:Transcript_71334/g.162047  ORF Transcript_71334/g.162047 Transcript_71334/m.162047 type:complete len:325 (-) Transcript_71334:92-1066(-)